MALEDGTLIAAVDIYIRADDKTRTIRGDERNRFSDVFWNAPSTKRNLGTPLRFLLLQASTQIMFIK